jgi:DNA-binding PadR family transcriptional regulator
MNTTQSAVLRALSLCAVLDVEHTAEDVHRAFRAVRHELETLRGIHCPQAPAEAPELQSAHTGRATQPGSLRHKILAVLDFGPMADFQVREQLSRDRADGPGWPQIGQVRRRRHELVAAGWVEAVLLGGGVRKVRQEETGRDCTAYQLTDRGHAALRRLRSGQEVLFTV